MGEAPENTLVCFQKAVEQGAGFVEFDVRGTKDGEVVIIHDATLERTASGRGRVKHRGLKDLKALDAGYRFTPDGGRSFPCRGQSIEIPTLAEFLTAFRETRAIVEIKQARPSIVRRVIEIVRDLHSEDRVLLATERDEIMREIRGQIHEQHLTIATGFSYGEVAAFMTWLGEGRTRSYQPLGQAFQIPPVYQGMALVNRQTVAAAHELGIEMFVWTVNDIEEMKRLLELEVDGIITDYPARLRQLVSRET